MSENGVPVAPAPVIGEVLVGSRTTPPAPILAVTPASTFTCQLSDGTSLNATLNTLVTWVSDSTETPLIDPKRW